MIYFPGYINHRTELVVVKMPDLTETDGITQKFDAPLVSDFLTQYKHPSTDCHPQSKTVTEVHVMSGELLLSVFQLVVDDDVYYISLYESFTITAICNDSRYCSTMDGLQIDHSFMLCVRVDVFHFLQKHFLMSFSLGGG